MNRSGQGLRPHHADVAPGDPRVGRHEITQELTSYLVGLGLAIVLSIVSFVIARTQLVWAPSIPIALFVLAVAQMGVHLVFFLHINTGPDNANNVLALAFGVLIVMLLMVGSIWIMAHLNHNMMPLARMMEMQR